MFGKVQDFINETWKRYDKQHKTLVYLVLLYVLLFVLGFIPMYDVGSFNEYDSIFSYYSEFEQGFIFLLAYFGSIIGFIIACITAFRREKKKVYYIILLFGNMMFVAYFIFLQMLFEFDMVENGYKYVPLVLQSISILVVLFFSYKLIRQLDEIVEEEYVVRARRYLIYVVNGLTVLVVFWFLIMNEGHWFDDRIETLYRGNIPTILFLMFGFSGFLLQKHQISNDRFMRRYYAIPIAIMLYLMMFMAIENDEIYPFIPIFMFLGVPILIIEIYKSDKRQTKIKINNT